MTKEIKVRIKPPRKYPPEPFSQFRDNLAWDAIDNAIEYLVDKQDMVETTVRKCIVGSIIKRLSEKGLLKQIPEDASNG